MESELFELFESSNDEYNYVIYQNLKGRYNISPKNLDKFWMLYCTLVENGRELYIGEHIRETTPFYLNFTFSFKDKLDVYYEEEFIYHIIFDIQQILLNYLDIYDNNVICCFLEPDEDIEINNTVVVNFKLHFPYCRVESQIFKILKEKVIDVIDKEGRLKMLNVPHINTVYITNNFNDITCPLYGSCIDKELPDFRLTHIFGKIALHEICSPHELELADVFKINNHLHYTQGLLSQELIDSKPEFLIPLFLSINFNSIISVPRVEIKQVSKGNTAISDIATNLLFMIKRSRIKDEYDWINIGMALYTSFDGSASGLRLWSEFSCDYYKYEECEKLYNTFEHNNYLTYKTLGYYARQDNYKLYNEWHRLWVLESLEKAESCTHVDVAEYIYRFLWIDFCSAKGKRWLKYVLHSWKQDEKDLTLTINNNIIQDISEYARNLSRETNEKTIKNLNNLIARLKNNTFKHSILKELYQMFYDENFDKYENKLTFLTGIKNGVIHVYKDKCYFRFGKPEDYITKTSDITWKSSLTNNSVLVQRCYDWLNKVFPIQSLLDYFLKISASSLRGKNTEKKFIVLTGSGDNSKSMIKKLFEATFGTYFVNLPTSLVTKKRTNSSAPTPELVQCKGAKIAFLQEPDRNENFQTGIIKELTGGDMFFARSLNENGTNIMPTFLLFLMCNQIPSIDHYEKAFSNRLRIIPFLSTWVKNAPESIEEQYSKRLFKADPAFEETIPILAPAFLWILVNYYKKYEEEGLIEPQEVIDYTRKYWEENNYFREYFNENIVQDEGSTLTVTAAHNNFKLWFQESYPKVQIPNKHLFKEQMICILGEPTRNGWEGYTLANED